MNSFVNAVNNAVDNEMTRTENGMKARKSTGTAVLDLFGKIGSSRGTVLEKEFRAACAEDLDLAVRVLLWARDIREGAGERKQFMDLWRVLEKVNPNVASLVLYRLSEMGRWKDFFYTSKNKGARWLAQTPTNVEVSKRLIAEGLRDQNARKLVAKFMPRTGSTAEELARFVNLTPRAWRKLMVRTADTVEALMCAKEWDAIDFSKVPSLAASRYQKAFSRNAAERYDAYRRELAKPVSERAPGVKINAGAVYPYDIVKGVRNGDKTVSDAQWDALPNYVGDASILPMVDVSGSMTSGSGFPGNLTPMDVAISLGLYCSSKNTGEFKDLYLTFSEVPKLIKSKGPLSTRVHTMERTNVGYGTNLHRAFDCVLDLAVKNKVKAADMPKIILVLSDMQFNACWKFDDSALQMVERKYAKAGYPRPKLVWWNLNGGYGRDNTPVKFDDLGTCLVSGFSPAILKTVLAADFENFTPYSIMMNTIMKDRYNPPALD